MAEAMPAAPAGDLQRERELLLNVGPQHPSTHGVLRVIAKLNGETIVTAQPDIGYLHRCFEKLAESKSYPMVMPYTDRTDYLGAITNEWVYALAVEKLLGVEVPERAEYIRVIAAEMQRVCSHLLWFGTFALDLGAVTPFLYAFRERETLYDLYEQLTGARLLYNYLRIGGVRNDMPNGFVEKLVDLLDFLEKKAFNEYRVLLTGNRIFEVRTLNVGELSSQDAIAWGASGPVLRGSGVKWDLRRDAPYSVYDRFDFEVPVGKDPGDVYDRYAMRMREMEESVKIIRQALQQLPTGEIMGKVPKIIKPPKGEVYTRVEAPRGEVGCYLISDGTTNPYRLHWRSPCYTHLQLIPLLSPGFKVADLVAIIGSIDIVLGEVDR